MINLGIENIRLNSKKDKEKQLLKKKLYNFFKK